MENLQLGVDRIKDEEEEAADRLGNGMTMVQKWQDYKEAVKLQRSTRIDMATLVKLLAIPQEGWDTMLIEYGKGSTLTELSGFLMVYGIEIDRRALARFLRRTQPTFIQAENDRREGRIVKRQLRKITKIGC
jgi:transposase